MASPEPTPIAPPEADGQGSDARPAHEIMLFGFELIEYSAFDRTATPTNPIVLATPSIEMLRLAHHVIGKAWVDSLPAEVRHRAHDLLVTARVRVTELLKEPF